ncbi:MAG: RRXRR domain-containing protein, partial [Eubacteriales bacterium]|nr:RRXRR domain-containing protein [Eubacteriales bacterium]
MEHNDYVYVQDAGGNPLMPTKRYRWVRHALKDGRAKVVQRLSFTIRLQYEPGTKETQPVVLGVDPGRTNIGLAAVKEDGTCLYLAQCETRNKEIAKRMQERL